MAQLYEAYDSTGNKIGKNLTRHELQLQQLWQLVVHVWIVDEQNNLLVQQRSHTTTTFNDLWDISVGGTVDLGEDSDATAVRETKEELGLSITKDKLIYLGRVKMSPKPISPDFMERDLSDEYLLRLPHIAFADLKLQAEEVQAVDTMPLTELRRITQDPMLAQRLVPHGADYYDTLITMILAYPNTSLH